MNLSISPIRTAVQDPANGHNPSSQAFGKHAGHGNAFGGEHQNLASSGQGIFAHRAQQQVNFGPPQELNGKPGAHGPQAAAGQSDMLEQLLEVIQKAVMQWLQSLLKSKEDEGGESSSPVGAKNLATQGGSSGAGEAGGPHEANATTSTQGVAPETGLSGSGELHLPPQLEPYRADILDAAKQTGMPANVIAGQIWAESRGKLGEDTTNVNGKKDAGLMQVNADTFAALKKENPGLLGNADVNNPHDNIMAGALYLRDQSKAFDGNMGAALRAYNSGPDKVNLNNLADAGGVGGSSYPADVLKFAEIIGSGKGQLPG
nr:transglycosylase SLT domain-containing protein [Pseudomonas frederiksbergensis]